jgi:hypothetical protein
VTPALPMFTPSNQPGSLTASASAIPKPSFQPSEKGGVSRNSHTLVDQKLGSIRHPPKTSLRWLTWSLQQRSSPGKD